MVYVSFTIDALGSMLLLQLLNFVFKVDMLSFAMSICILLTESMAGDSICRVQNQNVRRAGRYEARRGVAEREATERGGAWQNEISTIRFDHKAIVYLSPQVNISLQGKNMNSPERIFESTSEETLCKPMEGDNKRLMCGLSAARRSSFLAADHMTDAHASL